MRGRGYTHTDQFTTIYPGEQIGGYVRLEESVRADALLYIEVGGFVQHTHLDRESVIRLVREALRRAGIDPAEAFPKEEN